HPHRGIRPALPDAAGTDPGGFRDQREPGSSGRRRDGAGEQLHPDPGAYVLMDRHTPWWLRAGALMLAASLLPAPATPRAIERRLAVVDGRVVSQSDLRRHVELARLLGDDVPADEGRLLAEVIENRLIDRQVEQFPGIRVDDARVDAYLASSSLAGDDVDAPL